MIRSHLEASLENLCPPLNVLSSRAYVLICALLFSTYVLFLIHALYYQPQENKLAFLMSLCGPTLLNIMCCTQPQIKSILLTHEMMNLRQPINTTLVLREKKMECTCSEQPPFAHCCWSNHSLWAEWRTAPTISYWIHLSPVPPDYSPQKAVADIFLKLL